NLFVAGFIGSPPMNLISGVLEEQAAGAMVSIRQKQGGEVRLYVGPMLPAYRPHVGASVLLGIRPEALTLANGAAREHTVFDARIDVIEPTGADNLAFLTLGETDVIARLPPGKNAAGDRIELQIDPERTLIFDPRTEKLIR
ncbi:MAG TPA: TOBE domain-containing protein, partial [Bauldia sp.]|nr:TOBE domain-containing protein [Bauldia sp.]